MAQGRIPLRYKEKRFTVDCTTPANNGGIGYCGQLDLYSETEGATIIIPLFARKAGNNYPITAGFEGRTARVFSNTAIDGVTVGILLVF